MIILTGIERSSTLSGEGQFIFSGPNEFIQQHSRKVAEFLEGKGGGKGGLYQGKANAKKLQQIESTRTFLESL